MFALYVTLTSLTAISAAAGAWMGFVRHPGTVAAAAEVQIPASWMLPLGSLLAAGALGLLAGFAIPAVGIAAATGLVVYIAGAIVAHRRVKDFQLTQPSIFLALAAATLAITVAYQLR